MDLELLHFNKYQTPITDTLIEQYPEEVIEQLYDFIETVPFIRNLVSPDRRYAKDMPKDDKGRIIVDLENPHIIEDAEYFMQPAIHYVKYECYTFLKPNSNPQSEYRKFWSEERRRCREGYVRESDGEWITGFCYWFLNYNRMLVNKIVEGQKKAIRIESFPFFFEGIYWRFHYLYQAREAGKHAIELAKRGCAKSYSLSAIMTHNLILGESEESKRRVTTVLAAYQKEYLKDDKDGTFSKFKPALDFIRTNTPFPRLLIKNSPNEMAWQMGYKDEYGRVKGSLNNVLGISVKEDTDKIRGKRGWILFEEMGTFAGLLATYDTVRKGVEDGDYTFATIYLVGTANESESDFSSAKKLLQSPDGYKILSVSNVYDKVKQGSNRFGFFYPSYVNRAGCSNKDGVSDVIKALLQILMARYNAKYNSADPKSVLRVIAEDPITPAEAIIKVKAAYFPIQQLSERKRQLDANPNSFDDVYIADLVLNNGVVEYRPSTGTPIRSFEKIPNSTEGAIEIFAMPERDSTGQVFRQRYIIGHDPVDNDQADSSSFSSTFVFDLFTDQIVAEYTGRKAFADDNFEIVRLLCLYYNAKVMYESNKKGIFAYFSKMNATHLLAETPQYLRDQQMIKYQAVGSNKYGINANANINNYANDLIRQWLLKPVPIISKDEQGNDIEVAMPNLYNIRNRALIEELESFTPEINVDRIRALGMVMLYRQEKIILFQGNMSRAVSNNSKRASNDDFFNKNYNQR